MLERKESVRSSARSMRGFLVGCAVAAVCSAAQAEISNVVYTVKATNSLGSAMAEWTFQQGNWNPQTNTYSWIMQSPKELKDPNSGALIGTIHQANTVIIGDPQISLGFLVQAGAVNTTFEITSALLSFPAIPSAEGKASVQMGITDLNGDGSELMGLIPGPAAYHAQYNGFVPGGSDFSKLIGSVTASPGGSGNAFQNDPPVGNKPVGATVNDMSARIRFSLTALDTASGTSVYTIIPEPTSFALLAIGSIIAFWRRR
jgi:hypothetical protein